MMPPMLAATPLNAATSDRSHRGRVAVAAAYAISVAEDDAERRPTPTTASSIRRTPAARR